MNDCKSKKMTKDSANRSGQISLPPRQDPGRMAHQKAVEALSGQSVAQLQWLGADRSGAGWHLPVIDGVLLVDTTTGAVCREGGGTARPAWQILALHYLALRTRPLARPPEVTFASLPSARVYAGVYENRVNRRLCAHVGNSVQLLRAAAAAIKAREVASGNATFEVDVFPRIPIRLIWYAGDEEFAPSCTLLLPANIESFFCIEDIVVLSESLVSRLGGQPF